MQQFERHARPAEFLMNPDQVRLRSVPLDFAGGRTVERPLQDVIAERVDLRPRQPARLRPSHHRRHGPGADAETSGGFPVAPLGDPLESQHLSNLSHRQSFRRHRSLSSS